ncbi:MAG: protein tyrosine kinase [Sphingomonadales bacterium]
MSKNQMQIDQPGPESDGDIVDDGAPRFDGPIRDALLRQGYLTKEQAAHVQRHQAERGLDFDQAALELGYISTDDLDRARDQLVTSLALVASVRRPVSDELAVLSDPGGLQSEAFRLLRTQIISQHIRNGRRGLAIVAPADGVGCTYVAGNLAVALSQAGLKTLIIDANMRNPRLDQMFGFEPDAPGLSSFLTLQVARPERVVSANVLPSLAVMTAGPATARPQELLSGHRFRDGVNTLLREYDLVIFDTPAANTNADALSVGSAAGYGLLVARRDQSYYRDIITLRGQLTDSRCVVVGSVLNEF